jgi:hypothetical protein
LIQFKYQIWCAQAANVFVARDGASVLLEMADVYANGSKGAGDARRKIARRPARLTRAGGGAGAGETVWEAQQEQRAHRENPNHPNFLRLLKAIMGSRWVPPPPFVLSGHAASLPPY